MENPITSSPKFKVGQLWRTRSGREARIKRISTMNTSYPILSNIGNEHWHYADGRSCLNSAREHSCDLVELLEDVVTENEAIIAKPITPTQAKKNFMEHPITPPSNLIEKWRDEGLDLFPDDEYPCPCDIDDARDEYIAIQAARWGADQQLEQDAEWLNQNGLNEAHLRIMPVGELLKEAMRSPTPSRLKQKALEEVAGAVAGGNITPERGAAIRLALELIPDDL